MNKEKGPDSNNEKPNERIENEPTSRIVRAAGGLIQNGRGEVLFMYRRNKWDLPKGKIDPGESPEECALREVKEETGIPDVELMEFLLITHHTYEEGSQSILKETHWFRMFCPGDPEPIPQAEEDITELKWLKESAFSEATGNTYPNILEVLRAAGYRLT
jgi:8-oxo-dGTP pyrophosphatase MutT (NUDIX family)